MYNTYFKIMDDQKLIGYHYNIYLEEPLKYYSLPLHLVKIGDLHYQYKHEKQTMSESLTVLESIIKQLDMKVHYIEQQIIHNKLYYVKD